MKVRIEICLLALISLRMNTARGQDFMPGAESAGLAGMAVVLENPWSAAGNPAGLTGVNKMSAGTSLEQRYLLKELGNYAVALAVPAWRGTIGIVTAYEGCERWTRQTSNLSGAIAIGPALSTGASICYIYQKAGNAGRAVHQASFSLGASVRVSGTVTVAFSAFNPFNLYYSSAAYSSLTSCYRLGLAYRPHTSFVLLSELAKDINYPVSFAIACEYGAAEKIIIRGGIRLFPASYAFGATYRVNKLLIGLSAKYHQYLGFTPCTSIQYSFR
jgi:hypothetical protein